MLASLLFDLADPYYLIWHPWYLLLALFQVWMLVDAVRREEWLWAVFIFFGFGLVAVFYFLLVYRANNAPGQGFELPGARAGERIKVLQEKIRHLDNAYHHFQLGDLYFQKGRYEKAEACYRASLERDGQDLDARAHLGQCLLRQGKAAEARPLLEAVCHENARHDFGYTLMAYAEALTAMGENETAWNVWKKIVAEHAYARAKVQFSELCIKRQEWEQARLQLEEVLAEDRNAPAFTRKRDRVWVVRARRLLRTLPH